MKLQAEAQAILEARSKEYPPFEDEADRVCSVANALYPGLELSPIQYAFILLAMKLCRETRRHKRDNLIDAVNYLSFIDELNNED